MYENILLYLLEYLEETNNQLTDPVHTGLFVLSIRFKRVPVEPDHTLVHNKRWASSECSIWYPE